MSKRKPPGRGTPKRGPKSTTRKPAARKPVAKKAVAKSGAKKAAPRKAAARKPAPRKAVAAEPEAPLAALAGTTDLRSSLGSSMDEQWSFGSMFKRMNLRERPTQIALVSIALVIALVAAAIAWPSGDKDETSDLASDTTTTESTTDDETVATAEPTATDGTKTNTSNNAGPVEQNLPPAVGNPGDRAQALAVGAKIKPQSTSLPNGNPNTWTGVTKDKIKFAIAYDASSCGVNTLTLAQQAGANLATAGRYYRGTPNNQSTARAEFREAAEQIIKIANLRALEGAEDFPQIRKLMGNDPTHPFFGRRLTYELVDGGSYQCPETTTAAAIKIIEDIKPFVVINDDALSRSAYNMAAALNAKAPASSRPMHFGTLSESDALYKKWSPFVWTQFTSGTAAMRQYASWLCTRVNGKNAVNSSVYKGQKRKIALLYPNFQQVKIIANELKGFTNTYCGKNPFGTEIAYSTDPSRAADEGTTIAVRLKSQGYTTISYLLDLVAPLFHIIAFSGQDYKPEFAFTPTNYMDSSTVQRLYEQPIVDKASFGITNLGVPGGFGYTAGDPFDAWHDTHRKSPNSGKACDPSSDAGMNHDEKYCKAPGAIVTLYYSILPLLGGILFAGPDLTPRHVTDGLQTYPETRFGGNGPTTDPRPALVGAGKGQHYFLVDATEWRWRSGFVSPAPESKLGWAEYPDCQRHYYLWPDKLAKYWEKGGKEYNAWCGSDKYAPKNYKPKDPETCADTPSGVCEKDNYPRWGPENNAPKY